ncbi:MAG: glycosyltransferase [Thermoleophilia bacterium]
MSSRLTLGIISHERVADSMSGPAIRCWEFARALSADADVRLFTPQASDLAAEGFELITYDREDREGLAGSVTDCDVLLAQGFTFNDNPALTQMGKLLIVDLYVPMTLEAMGQYEHLPIPEQTAIQQGIIAALKHQLAIGHFFICASERQRDFWLGWLSMAGRVAPAVYQRDRTLHELIGVVPFGLSDTPPVARKKVLKGVHPAIRESDRVLLWGGGIYNWLDPFTPIRAVAELAQKRDDIKLFFMGARHPNPNVPKMRAYDEAMALSEKLGVLDTAVFFNDKWVPYADRVDYLLESDLGANANIDHVETRFSFRTRILDCIWASLPLISTEGDSLSMLAARKELGLVVPSGDVTAYATATERLLDDSDLYDRCRRNLEAVARDFRWSETTVPLKLFLARIEAAGAGAFPGRKIEMMNTASASAEDQADPAGSPPAGASFLRRAARNMKGRLS